MGDQGGGKAIIQRCITDEELLREDVIDEIPDEHRPGDKELAQKLKVEHEFRTRFSAKVQRKAKRMRGGKQTPGDEIWMHWKTAEEDVRAFVERRRVADGEAEKEHEERPGEGGGFGGDGEVESEDSDVEGRDGQGERERGEGEDEMERMERPGDETWLGRPPSWRRPVDEGTEENGNS